jgi:branched-chain amino acid transport system permease protein
MPEVSANMLAQLVVNGLVVGSLYSLMAISVGLTYRTCKFLDFSKAAVAAVAAYLAFSLVSHAGLAPFAAISAAVIIATCLACFCHVATYERLMRRRATSLVMLLASLGILVAVEGMLNLAFGAESFSFPHQIIGRGINVGIARITGPGIALLAGNLLVVCSLWMLHAHTRYGLCLRAIASDRTLARISGVSVEWVIFGSAVISALVAAIAGVLKAYDTGLAPAMGFDALLVGMIAVLLGGGLLRDSAAAVSLGVLQQVSVSILPAEWQRATVFVVVLGFLLLRGTLPIRPRESAASGGG